MKEEVKEKLLSVGELIEELKNRGIKLYRVEIYRMMDTGEIPENYYVVERKRSYRRYRFKPEVIDFLEEKTKTNQIVLTTKDVIEKLRKKGIFLTPDNVRYYVKKGFIPKELVIIKKRFSRNYYYFHPSVVEYLEGKLRGIYQENNTAENS